MQHLAIPHNQRARDLVERFDFGPVIRCALSKGMTPSTAARALEQLKRFLIACAEHPNSDIAPPSSACDELWHAFIVADTRSYCRFCDVVYGEYLHHNGATASPERLAAARRMTNRVFGVSATAEDPRAPLGSVDCLREAIAPDCLSEASPARL